MQSRKLRGINPIQGCRLPLQVKFLALAAIALVAFCGVNLMAQICPGSSSGRCFPVTTNGIYTYSDQVEMSTSAGVTDAQIQFFANNFVGGQKQTATQVATLRGYNSNFMMLHYRLAEMLGYGSCDSNGNPTANSPLTIVDTPSGDWGIEWPWADNTDNPQTVTTPYPGGSPEESSWYAGVNAPIAGDPNVYGTSPWVYDCSMQHYLMNIADLSSTGWPAYYSGLVLQELADNNDDGVFADSFSVPNEWGTWTPSLPGLDTTFEQTWSTNMHNYTDYIMGNPIGSPIYSNPNALSGNYLWIPNVGSWTVTRDITDYTNVDGAMIEDFASYGNENFLAPSDWALQMNRVIQLTNLNKIMIMQDYPNGYNHPNPPYTGSYERLFDTASYLLVKGNYTYLNLDAKGQSLEWWPEYNIPIGAPTQALPSTATGISGFWDSSWNAYKRRYSNGIVLVNPTASDSGTINLGGTYYLATDDLDPANGHLVPADGVPTSSITYTVVTSVDLAPCPSNPNGTICAAILLYPGTTGLPSLLTSTVTVTPSATNITTSDTLSVTVAVNGGTGNPTPTGMVTLTSGGYNSGATALASGSATIVIPAGSLAVGSADKLLATYTPAINATPAPGDATTYFGAQGSYSPVTVTAVVLTGPNGEYDWTWMSGSSTVSGALTGVYGTGYGSVGMPGGRLWPSMWTDSAGNIWLFGGSDVNWNYFNDLWEYNPAANQWIWMNGPNVTNDPGSFGALGQFAPGNNPPSRNMATTWIDNNGNFWLFGGWSNISGNDLWEYSPALNQWAWWGGSITPGNYANGVYGTQGVPSTSNVPGGRAWMVSWADSYGNLWLFGGNGVDSVPNEWGDLNDLWEYSIAAGTWTWVSGSSTVGSNGGQPGVYGTQGVPNAVNVPGGRNQMSAWTDANGNFWLFGGNGYDSTDTNGMLNDLWEFNPSTGLWTWVSGSNTVGGAGVSGTMGTPASTNVPIARGDSVSWTDGGGNLWLFGGGDASGNSYNDIWEFTPSLSEWAWMGGGSNQAGVYGELGITAPGDTPGSRLYASGVTDRSNHLWLFGGQGLDSTGAGGALNDLWMYKPPAPTTPTVTATLSASSITTAQDLAVTVTVLGNPSPTGWVTLTGGGYTSTAAPLVSGSATINIVAGALAIGSDTLTVSYMPDMASSTLYNAASGTASVAVTAFVPQDFSIGGTAVTLAPGATSGNTSTITITPSGGFTGNVQLLAAITNSPTGAVQLPTLSFTANPVSISGTAAGTATLTITTTAPVSPTTISKGTGSWYAAGGATLACLLLFGIPARRRSWRTMLGMLLLLVALAGGVLGCGSTNTFITPETPGTTEGTYTITVIGTSGATTESGTVSLTVQ